MLRPEREALGRQQAQIRQLVPTLEELKPALRRRLQDLEATLTADLASGRLALGALLSDQRIPVHRDGRLEGLVRIQPEEKLPAPRRSPRPGVRMVAGEGYARGLARRPVPLVLPLAGQVAA